VGDGDAGGAAPELLQDQPGERLGDGALPGHLEEADVPLLYAQDGPQAQEVPHHLAEAGKAAVSGQVGEVGHAEVKAGALEPLHLPHHLFLLRAPLKHLHRP
jgi:hypothetical protein